MNIGERQTVDHAKHPRLGEGRAVYGNGPAFFIADSGEMETMSRIDMGGASMGRSWLRAWSLDGTQLELETTKRQHGDHHRRAMTQEGVRGWLVSVSKPLDEPRTGFMRYRWEPDGGTPRALYVTVMEAGPPGALKRMERRKSKSFLPDEEPWRTFTLTEGPKFVWCDERNAPTVAAKPKPAQSALFLP